MRQAAAGVPDPRSWEVELNRDAWNAVGERVASPYMASAVYASFFSRFCDALPAGARVLDFGCGPGVPAAKALVRHGMNVTGVDLSETMVAAASRNVPEARFVCCSMTEIGFREAFDGVFSSYSMLCLSPDSFELAAVRASDALVPGGLFFLALNEGGDEPTADGDHCSTIMGQRMYSRAYSEREVRERFSRAGLTVVELSRDVVRTEEYGDEHMLVVLFRKGVV